MYEGDVALTQSNRPALKAELDKLVKAGELLRIAFILEVKKVPAKNAENVKTLKLPVFREIMRLGIPWRCGL